MKTNKILLTTAIITSLSTTAMASNNTQVFSTGQYRTSVEADNSIIYGEDINVTQHNDGKVVKNIIAGGYNNLVQHDANNSATFGTSNNNNSANSVVAGFHNTITNADNSIAGGVQNASHSANTLVFGNTNAIDSNSDNSFAGGKKVKVQGENSFAFGEEAHAFGNNAIAIGKNVEALGDNSINMGADNTVQDSLSNGVIIGTNNKINTYYSDGLNGKNIVAIGNGNIFENSSESIAIGGSIIQSADHSVGIGANSKVAAPNSVALGYDSMADDVESTESAEINGKTYTFAGGVAHGTVGIGARGDNGERTITGLAAGRISDTSTDAVNGSQLNSVVDAINNNANAIANLNNNAVVQGGENIHIDTVNGNQRGVSLSRNLQHMESAQFGNDDGDTGTYINKETVLVANNNSYTNMSADAVRTFNGSENTGMTAKGIVIENTDTLEQASFTSGGMQASDDNATIRFTTTDVNVGNQQIHGVTAGVAGTDAVNVSQLKEVENKIAYVGRNTINQANQYTDSQVAHVGAQSAALAGLHPLDFNKDDKASYAASVGHYRNANAVAVGVFYRPNERTMISGAVSFGKHAQMNLGVAFKTGKGSEYVNEAKSKDSRIEKLEALVEKLTAEVAELKASK